MQPFSRASVRYRPMKMTNFSISLRSAGWFSHKEGSNGSISSPQVKGIPALLSLSLLGEA